MKYEIIAILAMATNSLFGGVVADTLYLEARGEGADGIRAVATVIYNRAKAKNKSFEAICLQPKQFSCWNGSKSRVITPKNDLDRKAYNLCIKIEESLLNGNFEPLGDWTHYYAYKVCAPKWARGAKTTTIGNHKFLKTK